MNARTFKSITGFDNYYAFKSLLENSSFRIFQNQDETIVFNSIVCLNGANNYVLNSNQVAVVLSEYNQNGGWNANDVNGNTIKFSRLYTCDNLFIISNKISSVAGLLDDVITFAIFDLY